MRRFVVIVWHGRDGTKRRVTAPSLVLTRRAAAAVAAALGRGRLTEALGHGQRLVEVGGRVRVRVAGARVLTEHHSPHRLRGHGVATRAHALARGRGQGRVPGLMQLKVPFPFCVRGFVEQIDW